MAVAAAAPGAAHAPPVRVPARAPLQLTRRASPPPSRPRRQGMAKKVERSRKQLKERKNRTKKLRGVKKAKGT